MTDIVEQADEIERLRAERDRAIKTTSAFALDVAAKDTEIERLRAALQTVREENDRAKRQFTNVSNKILDEACRILGSK